MALRKPFVAVPVKLGDAFRERRELEQIAIQSKSRRSTALVAGFGLLAGCGLGFAIVTDAGAGLFPLIKSAPALIDVRGFGRARTPQPGDYWGGCNSARAAGTAPIYYGEPGYRSEMDGDGDGVACEPVPLLAP